MQKSFYELKNCSQIYTKTLSPCTVLETCLNQSCFYSQQADQDAAEEDRRLKEEAQIAAVGPLVTLGPAISVNAAGDVAQAVGNVRRVPS